MMGQLNMIRVQNCGANDQMTPSSAKERNPLS